MKAEIVPLGLNAGTFHDNNRVLRRYCCPYLFAVLIMFAGLFLRMCTLHEQSVWNDEYVSVAYLDAPHWSAFQDGYKQHDRYMPPVYYAMLYGWARLAGNSAWMLRMLSVLISIVSLCLVYVIGKHLFGSGGALCAMTLFAFSPQQIYHAQGIRCYSLVVLLGLLSAFTFLRMLHRGGRVWWTANVVCTVLLVWTHLGGLLLLCAWSAGGLLWLCQYRVRIIAWLAAQGFLILPLLGIAALTMRDQSAMGAGSLASLNPFMFLVVLIAPFFKDSAYLLDALPGEYVLNAKVFAPWYIGGRICLLACPYCWLFFLR